MGGLLALPQFQARFEHPTPTMQGFMVASYDVSLQFIDILDPTTHACLNS